MPEISWCCTASSAPRISYSSLGIANAPPLLCQSIVYRTPSRLTHLCPYALRTPCMRASNLWCVMTCHNLSQSLPSAHSSRSNRTVRRMSTAAILAHSTAGLARLRALHRLRLGRLMAGFRGLGLLVALEDLAAVEQVEEGAGHHHLDWDLAGILGNGGCWSGM